MLQNIPTLCEKKGAARARAPRVVLCLLTSPLELPCHAGLVKVGIGSSERGTDRRSDGERPGTGTLRRLAANDKHRRRRRVLVVDYAVERETEGSGGRRLSLNLKPESFFAS